MATKKGQFCSSRICSSQKSIDFQWTTWRYIPEDSTLSKTKFVLWKANGIPPNARASDTT
jgi:hypothetical protein